MIEKGKRSYVAEIKSGNTAAKKMPNGGGGGTTDIGVNPFETWFGFQIQPLEQKIKFQHHVGGFYSHLTFFLVVVVVAVRGGGGGRVTNISFPWTYVVVKWIVRVVCSNLRTKMAKKKRERSSHNRQHVWCAPFKLSVQWPCNLLNPPEDFFSSSTNITTNSWKKK